MSRKKNKLWRYRMGIGILASAVTLAVVLACLFLPEYLLKIEKSRDIGHAMRGENEYYADDVSSGMSLELTFNQRLMMLSGQWTCQRESVDMLAYQDERDAAQSFCADFLSFVYENVEGVYPTHWGDMVGKMPDNGGTAFENGAELPYGPYCANAWLQFGDVQLYCYTDKILNTYDFYVWEYVLYDEESGIDIRMLLDAVTYDIYSFSFHGKVFDSLSWKETYWKWLAIFTDIVYDGGNGYNDVLRAELTEFTQSEVFTDYLSMAGMIVQKMVRFYIMCPFWSDNVFVAPTEWQNNGYQSPKHMALKNISFLDFVSDYLAVLHGPEGIAYLQVDVSKGLDVTYTLDTEDLH